MASTAASERRERLQDRLDALLDRAERGGGLAALADSDLAELSRLHRALSTQLALRRGFGGSARQIEGLNASLVRSHGLLYGRAGGVRRGRSFDQVLAVAETVRRSWRYHALAAVLLIAGGVYGYVGAGLDREWALEFSMPGDERTVYARTEELAASLQHGRSGTATEMSGGAKAFFTAILWQNNTRVALLAFFLGAAAGIPTMLLVLMNGLLLGIYTRAFHDRGLAYEWWAWILPHGVTELLAIVLLAGGGLWIGRLVVAPGEVSRATALRLVRPDVLRLLVLAFPMLMVAALIESFVRQSGMSEPMRYVFAGATAVFWIGWLGFGRRSTARRSRERAAGTLIERAVPLPIDAEVFDAHQSTPWRRTSR